jgi:hypothetical protein
MTNAPENSRDVQDYCNKQDKQLHLSIQGYTELTEKETLADSPDFVVEVCYFEKAETFSFLLADEEPTRVTVNTMRVIGFLVCISRFLPDWYAEPLGIGSI